MVAFGTVAPIAAQVIVYPGATQIIGERSLIEIEIETYADSQNWCHLDGVR
jgi:hypothetical protein